MDRVRNFIIRIKGKIALAIVPLVLLFTYKADISWQDRLSYLFEVILKSAPIIFIYGIVDTWYGNNKLFAIALSTALLLNFLVGARYHWIKGSFNLGKMLWKNLEMLIVVVGVYLLLGVLSYPLSESIVGTTFKMSIEFITILYPASKALRNFFILTGGKHPPKFIIQALYQYEKEGKLKEFFDSLNGGGGLNENK